MPTPNETLLFYDRQEARVVSTVGGQFFVRCASRVGGRRARGRYVSARMKPGETRRFAAGVCDDVVITWIPDECCPARRATP